MNTSQTMPDFCLKVTQRIQQLAPLKTSESSSLRRLISLSFDTELGICRLTVSLPQNDFQDAVKTTNTYRRLSSEHLEKLKAAHDLSVTLAEEIADACINVRRHMQKRFVTVQALIDEMRDSLQSPTTEQRAFLEEKKIFDFIQTAKSQVPEKDEAEGCLFFEMSPGVQDLDEEEFQGQLAPCTSALSRFYSALEMHSFVINNGQNRLVGGTTPVGFFKLFADAVRKNEQGMRKALDRAPELVRQVVTLAIKPYYSLEDVKVPC
jgi:hypothetical protein